MLTQVISAFMVRKLTLVNERYKLCHWQEVFDVMLTVVIQRVFEKDVSSFPLFDKVGKMLMLVWEREITNVASVVRTLPPNPPPPPFQKAKCWNFDCCSCFCRPSWLRNLLEDLQENERTRYRNQTLAIFTGEIITGKPRLPEGRGSNRACTFSQSVPELFQSYVLSARKCFLAKRRKKSKCFSYYTGLD